MENGGVSNPELILGQRIQNLRREGGLTQQGLCYKAHLSYSTLTKIERGAIKSPSIFTIMSIAEALNISVDELVGLKITSSVSSRHERKLRKSRDGISFVYFDVNGCLLRFYQKAFLAISDDYGIPSDRVEAVFWNYSEKINKAIFSIEQFNDNFSKKLGVDSLEWSKYYLEAVSEVPGMDELLKDTLKSYKVGLFTNSMPGFLEELIKLSKVPNLNYDAIVDSSKIGYVKPENKAYEIAQKKSEVPPSEILLIDDSRPNLIAAERHGWHSQWFDYTNPKISIETIKKLLEF